MESGDSETMKRSEGRTPLYQCTNIYIKIKNNLTMLHRFIQLLSYKHKIES